MLKRKFLPVVHHLKEDLSISQAKAVLDEGADGVFFISHGGLDTALYKPAETIKALYPDKLVGLNLLSAQALVALEIAESLNLDMLWSDYCGVSSKGVTDEGYAIAGYLAQSKLKFFGSVAFKYQAFEPYPALAASLASGLSMIPTTSGVGTGIVPNAAKIYGMSEAIRESLSGREYSLAVASGITPENIKPFLPYVTHFLVATGVSLDDYHFDKIKVREMVSIFKSYNQ